MNTSLPQIEMFPNHEQHKESQHKASPWYKSRRFLSFSISLVLSLSISLAYVYSRPALFRSYATLLTVAQTAIDQQSIQADIQHVAIQSQILSGQELLHQTLSHLQQTTTETENLSISDLRRILTVTAIANTNLVEIAATGYKAGLLVSIVNTVIDTYLTMRSEEIRQTTGATLEALQQELGNLEDKILITRTQLEEFKKANEITSLDNKSRFENQSLAHLKGLNNSLNKATEAVIKASSHLNAVKQSIKLGKIVVPDTDKAKARGLELHLQKLRGQLSKLDEKYTRDYILLDPALKQLPEDIEILKTKLKKLRNQGKSIVLAEAEQKYNAAQQTLVEVNRQLQEQQKKATDFSAKLSIGEALLNDLEGLELLHRTTRERLVKIEARQAEKFPQVKVIERAFLPRDPISPDYTRDALISVIAAILLALFFVWLVEFLNKKSDQKAFISISDINMYNASAEVLNNSQQRPLLTPNSSQILAHTQNNSLEYIYPDDIEPKILVDLLEEADIKAKQLISLLLSGLTLKEITLLNKEQIDFNKNIIHVRGEQQRRIFLNQALKSFFSSEETCPAWNNDKATTEDKLSTILIYAAVDAGLGNVQKITAESISHSYIIYLVKQGIRLSELEQIVGFIKPDELLQYSQFLPENRGLPISKINLVHPAMTVFT